MQAFAEKSPAEYAQYVNLLRPEAGLLVSMITTIAITIRTVTAVRVLLLNEQMRTTSVKTTLMVCKAVNITMDRDVPSHLYAWTDHYSEAQRFTITADNICWI